MDTQLERQLAALRPAQARDLARAAADSWARMIDDLNAGLDPFPSSQPFSEPLQGLYARELDGPEIFYRLFGTALQQLAAI